MRLELESTVTAPAQGPETEHNYPTGSEAEHLLRSGIEAAQSGDRVSARRLLFQASGIDPRCEDVWMWLASISEYPEELLVFLNNALDINPENRRAKEWRSATRSLLAKTFVQRAIAARQEGSTLQADQCIEQALNYDGECEMAWFWKASFSPTDDKKTECLLKVLEINPENEDAQKALDAITSARTNAAFREAKNAAVAGRRKKAFDLVEEFLESEPKNAEAWVLRSHLSLSLDQKIESLTRALELDPDNAAARSSLDFLLATVDEANGETQCESQAETDPADQFDEEPRGIDEGAVSAEQSFEDHQYNDVDEEQTLTAEPEGSVVFASVEPPAHAEFENGHYEQLSMDDDDPPAPPTRYCPYCDMPNDPQAFSCGSCNAVLTLSDIESLLQNTAADRSTIQNAVTQMEAEWNLRDFSENELIELGIGHMNLGNYSGGFKYIQEASRLDPNNVILAAQLKTIAIRLDEMKRQSEIHDAMPRGKTILVVDDSPTVRKLISGKLEKSGHHVICAEDGVEALERLEARLPDLVLLDIAMPRMDGYEVCKKIRSNPAAKDVPIVMISGKDGFFDKVRGRMAGTTGYVTKPFGPETLMKALETYLLPEQPAEA
jgi:twitching motility two-component system response regulator PilG